MAVSATSQPRQEFDGLGLGGQARFLKTLTSSVTTAWGVDWDEVYIVRDLMQNFFDANRGRVSEIRVDANGSDVVISAPRPFNLERLFYLGYEKDESEELQEWVSRLSEDELRALVGEIPALTLSKLRRELGQGDAPSATK